MFRRSFLVSVTTLMALSAVAAAPPPHEQSRIDKLIHFVEVQKGIGTITGRIDEDRITQLGSIPGVDAVERSRGVSVPDPAAGLH